MAEPRVRTLRRWFCILVLALVPLLYLVFMVARYSSNFPWLDQWELIPLLEKSYQGTLSLRDLWSVFYSQRLLFPRLIMIVLARLSGWNITWELATNILLGVGILAALIYQIRLTAESVGDHRLYWMIPIVSLMVFSLNQRMNWFWGWGMQTFLSVFPAVLGIILTAAPAFKWWRFLVALLLGVVATYSLANGILYWFVGLPILLVVPQANARTKRLTVALWIAVGLAVIASFLYDYQLGEGHPSLLAFYEQPLEYVQWVLVFLGVPLVIFARKVAMMASALGLILLCYASWVLIRVRQMRLRLLVPYLALSAFSIGSGLLMGIGRSGLGSKQALTSRYATIGMPFWISLVILLYLVASSSSSRLKESGGIVSRAVALLAISLIVALVVYGSALGSSIVIHDHRGWSTARSQLLSGPDDDLLRQFYFNPGVARERLEILKRYHLSIFRDQAR